MLVSGKGNTCSTGLNIWKAEDKADLISRFKRAKKGEVISNSLLRYENLLMGVLNVLVVFQKYKGNMYMYIYTYIYIYVNNMSN